MQNKYFRGLCVVAILLLGAWIRVSNYHFIFHSIPGRMYFYDPDAFYYLRRLVYLLSHFPNPLFFDPLADWPTGWGVDWPEGFLFILGLPLKIFNVHSFRALEIGASVVMIFLGLLSCWVNYLLAKRIFKENFWFAFLVLVLSAFNFTLVMYSSLGEIDHHIFEAFLPSLVLLLCLKAFVDRRVSAAVALGALIAFSLSISSSSLCAIGILFACLALYFDFHKTHKLFLYFLISFFVLAIPYVVFEVHIYREAFSMIHPSYFHLGFVVAAAVVSFLAMKFRSKLAWVTFGSATILPTLYWLRWPSGLMGAMHAAVQYVFGKEGILETISEAAPIFKTFDQIDLGSMHMRFGYLIYLLPLAWPLLVLSFFRAKSFSVEEKILFLSLTLISIPGIAQWRFSHMMVSLYLIFLVWLLSRVLKLLKQREMKLSQALVVLFLGLMILPNVKYGFVPDEQPGDRVRSGILKKFLNQLQISDSEVWSRLALDTSVADGVFANVNLGHALNYYTGLGTVTNSFFHFPSLEIDYALRTAPTMNAFENSLQKNKIKYFILTDDMYFFDLQYRMHGLKSDIFKPQIREENGKRLSVYNLDSLDKFAWFRLLFDSESKEIPPTFELLFRKKFDEIYDFTTVAVYRLSENSTK